MMESSRAAAGPIVRALAAYIEALDRRYPEGPEQMRRETLDSRVKITQMPVAKRNSAL